MGDIWPCFSARVEWVERDRLPFVEVTGTWAGNVHPTNHWGLEALVGIPSDGLNHQPMVSNSDRSRTSWIIGFTCKGSHTHTQSFHSHQHLPQSAASAYHMSQGCSHPLGWVDFVLCRQLVICDLLQFRPAQMMRSLGGQGLQPQRIGLEDQTTGRIKKRPRVSPQLLSQLTGEAAKMHEL